MGGGETQEILQNILFPCGKLEPGQLEEPSLALSLELAERGTLLMRLEPGKTEGLGGKITCHRKTPVLWKNSITFDDSSRNSTELSLFIVFQDKRSVSALC